MRKIGFTLAEVLITLTIIGVIAALTIPNLMQKHQEQEMVSRLKKSYTVLSNAFELAIRENGPVEDWDISPENTPVGAEKLYNYIKPYLKVRKYCGAGKGCFADSYKTMTGSAAWDSVENNNQNFFKFLLEDGSSVSLWVADEKCAYTEDLITNHCGNIQIDLNGKKGPNKLGIDLFSINITNEKLIPSKNKQKCTYKNVTNKNGASCTFWVITKGNMDYLRRDISNEW